MCKLIYTCTGEGKKIHFRFKKSKVNRINKEQKELNIFKKITKFCYFCI